MRTVLVLLSIFLLGTAGLFAQDSADRDKDYLKPIVDWDSDFFSKNRDFRGANWRGRDCDDWDKEVRPGVADKRDGKVDNNCNGIQGWSASKGMSNEDWLCGQSSPRGVVIFGDSAAAAFHIPEKWVQWAGLTSRYGDLLDYDWIKKTAKEARSLKEDERGDDFWSVIVHEFDWPHHSWATGFVDDINGQSIYMQMRTRNRCNHRDYQNLAVNGAKAQDLLDQVKLLSRSAEDKPILGFVAYIGNDICKKSLDKMTTPDDFRANILKGLEALNQKIAPDSKIMLVGLVDGRILWDTMNNRKHPLGLTYAELYEFLHSLDKNPCRTWLNPDKAIRDQASARAVELSNILKEIAATKKYSNFELGYMDLPMKEVLENWKKQGGDTATLIETVDGFHPSHTCHREIFKVIWQKLQTDYPSFIGPVNPYNAKIKELFSEQGGH